MQSILILGGTRFLGRHLADLALTAGHRVTLLHRGQTNRNLFAQATHLLGDRNTDLSALKGLHFDAVFDTSAYVPRQVQQVAQVLRGRVGQYHLVSSISAYDAYSPSGTTEEAPLRTLTDPSTETVDGSTYGGLKALCEAQAVAAFGQRCLVSRPGLLVGPHDASGRFAWWLQRVLRGGDVLAPGDPAAPVQFVDARDLAAWALLQAGRGSHGVFNINGPEQALTMGELLNAMRAQLNLQAHLHWVPETLLLAQGVSPWTDLPVWLDRAHENMHRINSDRARATGLTCRSLAQTLAETAAWCNSAEALAAVAGPDTDKGTVGLSAEREAQLLRQWWTPPG